MLTAEEAHELYVIVLTQLEIAEGMGQPRRVKQMRRAKELVLKLVDETAGRPAVTDDEVAVNESPTGHLDPPVPVTDYRFGIAGGAKYAMVCKHHPENHYRSKNPWTRSIFAVHPEHDCPCPLADLLVTWAPDDAHFD